MTASNADLRTRADLIFQIADALFTWRAEDLTQLRDAVLAVPSDGAEDLDGDHPPQLIVVRQCTCGAEDEP